jgi:hypothetical protein
MTSRWKKRAVLLTTGALLGAATFGACSDDAGADRKALPEEGVYPSPGDKFGDLWVFCDGSTRVYVAQDDSYASSAVAVSSNHPICGQR